MKTKIRTATLPAGLPAKFLLAVAAIILALLAMPQFGNAQGIVRGAQAPAKATGSPARSAAWLAAQSAPVSAAPWAP